MTPERTKEALQKLHRAYVEKLSQEINAVEQQWQEAVTDAYMDQALLRKVHLAVHSLSGSAATYNLPRTSQAFARMEEILEHITERGHPKPEDREAVAGLLDALKKMAQAAVQHLGAPDDDGVPYRTPGDRPARPARSKQPLALIVDDTQAVREKLRVEFEAGGFHVIEGANGEQALEQARHNKPDVIILDVRMEGVDGFEAQRRIRNEPSLKDTPIFFLTSARSINVQEIQTALAHGVAGYISKTTPLVQIVEKARAAVFAR